jgi:hypothetical protein
MLMRNPQYIISETGKRTGVVLSVHQYKRILEDLHDLSVIAERKGENPISLQEMKKRLKKDGLI